MLRGTSRSRAAALDNVVTATAADTETSPVTNGRPVRSTRNPLAVQQNNGRFPSKEKELEAPALETRTVATTDSDLESPQKPARTAIASKKRSAAGKKPIPTKQAKKNSIGIESATAAVVSLQATGDAVLTETLYEIVFNHRLALEPIIIDWIESYQQDPNEAMCDLVNFLIQAAGCTKPMVNRETIEDSDLITDALQDIQHQCSLQLQSDYPLAPKGKGRSSIKFRKTFEEFWTRWVRLVNSKIVTKKGSLLTELLSQWLATMSSSSFRPFRHTATTAALVILTGLCDSAQNNHTELAIANRQLETEQSKGVSQRLKQTETRVYDLQAKKSMLENRMKDLYDGIFIHRYRDTDSVIRSECIRELGQWIHKYPTYYLDSQHLRYLGWMLSDKIGHVRLDTLSSLNLLYAESSLIGGMRVFSERFKARILQMASCDIDSAVRQMAAVTISLFFKNGFIEDVDAENVVVLLMDSDIKIRNAVAPFVADWWLENYYQPAMDDEVTVSKLDETQQTCLKFKTLATAIVKIADLVNDRKTAVQTTQESTEAQANDQLENLEILSIRTCDLAPAHQMDSTLFERNFYQLLNFINLRAGNSDRHNANIGYYNVHTAVMALWPHVSCLKDYSIMCSFLLSDTLDSENTMANMSAKNEDPLRMTEDIECCLVLIFSSSVAITLSEINANATGKSGKLGAATAEKTDSETLQMSQILIENLPPLIQKYSSELVGYGLDSLVECIILIRSIPLVSFIDLRQIKVFETLFDDLIKLFLRRHENVLVSEICTTFSHFLGSKDAATSRDASNPELPNVAQSVSHQIAAIKTNTLLPLSLCVISTGKLQDLMGLLFSNQLNTSVKQLSLDPGSETLILLLRSINRCRELSYAVDVSNTDVFNASQFLQSSHDSIGIMDNVIDAMLQFIKSPPSNTADFDALTSAIMQNALDISIAELGFLLQRAFCSHTLKTKMTRNKPSSDNQTTPGTKGLDENNTMAVDASKSDHKSQDLLDKAVITELQARADQLVTICEAILTGDQTSPSAHFSIPMRWICLRTLCILYPMLNGGAGDVFPEIIRRPTGVVMAESMHLIDYIVNLSSFISIDTEELSSQSNTSIQDVSMREELQKKKPLPSTISSTASAILCHDLFKTIAGLRNFVCYGMYDRRCGSVVLKYYGIDQIAINSWMRQLMQHSTTQSLENVSNVTLPLVSVFDGVINGLGTSILEVVVRSGLERMTDTFVPQLAPNSDDIQHSLQNAKSALEDLCDLILDSITSSIDLYLTTKCPSLDHTQSLVKSLVLFIKTWPTALSSQSTEDISSGLKQFHNIVVHALLSMLCDAGVWMARRIQTWKHIKQIQQGSKISLDTSTSEFPSFQADISRMDESVSEVQGDKLIDDISARLVDDDREWLCAGFGIVSELRNINAAWRVWGSLGGAIAHVVQGLFVLVPRNPVNAEGGIQKDHITSVDIVSEFIFDQLAQAGIKPVEGDTEWADFWYFIDTLEKANGTVRKTKSTHTAENKASSRSGTPTRIYTRKSSANSSPSERMHTGRKQASVLGSGKKTPKQRRKSNSASKANQDDDETDVDFPQFQSEETIPVRRSNRASLGSSSVSGKRKTYNEDSHSESEEENAMPRSKNQVKHTGKNNGIEDMDEANGVSKLRSSKKVIAKSFEIDNDQISDAESDTTIGGRDLRTSRSRRKINTDKRDIMAKTGPKSMFAAKTTGDDGFASSPEPVSRKKVRRG
ncbi:hypothetical protein BDV3_005641 [Batrachochytrium dendrobatidis]